MPLAITPGYVLFDHIMWQPEFTCVHKCTGCYIQHHKEMDFTDAALRLGGAMTNLFWNERLRCNQFTLSLSHDNDQYNSGRYLAQLLELSSKYRGIISLAGKTIEDVANCIKSTQEYLHIEPKEVISQISTVAISTLDLDPHEPDTFKWFKGNNPDIQLVFNLRFETSGVIGNTITEEQNKILTAERRLFDIIHLILTKPILGLSPWHRITASDPTRRYYLTLLKDYQTMKSTLIDIAEREQLKAKIVEDYCLRAAKLYLQNRTTCSQNQLHIWPTGLATTCPYDSGCFTAINWKENIEETKFPNGIGYCHLPFIAQMIKGEQLQWLI